MAALEGTIQPALTDPTGLVSGPKRPPEGGRRVAEAKEAAEAFEAMFLAQMLNTMFAGIDTNGAFGGGHAQGIYRSILNDHYAEAIAKRGGIGLADTVLREILKHQEFGG